MRSGTIISDEIEVSFVIRNELDKEHVKQIEESLKETVRNYDSKQKKDNEIKSKLLQALDTYEESVKVVGVRLHKVNIDAENIFDTTKNLYDNKPLLAKISEASRDLCLANLNLIKDI